MPATNRPTEAEVREALEAQEGVTAAFKNPIDRIILYLARRGALMDEAVELLEAYAQDPSNPAARNVQADALLARIEGATP